MKRYFLNQGLLSRKKCFAKAFSCGGKGTYPGSTLTFITQSGKELTDICMDHSSTIKD